MRIFLFVLTGLIWAAVVSYLVSSFHAPSKPLDLQWQRDFARHAHRCFISDTSMKGCLRALKQTASKSQAKFAVREIKNWEDSKPIRAQEDFLRLIEKLGELIPADQEAELTLQALNLWLKSFDPYTHLIPKAYMQGLSRKKALEMSVHGPVLRMEIQHFFKPGLCQELELQLSDIAKNTKIETLELNLENNSGGSLEEAVCVADLFLPKGLVIVNLKNNVQPEGLPLAALPLNRRAENSKVLSQRQPVSQLPLIVRINRKSASASEVLAAALQSHSRARVKGERSFGKGSVQSISQPLDFESLLMYSTTQKWLTPKGLSLEAKGLEPDILDTRLDLLKLNN